MSIEEQIAELERQNAELSAKLPKPPGERSLLDLTKRSSGFKAFCRRRNTLPGSPSYFWRKFDKGVKGQASAMRSAMRAKGVNTVLGPYTTGRYVKISYEDRTYESLQDETAKLYRVGRSDEWESKLEYGEGAVIETVDQFFGPVVFGQDLPEEPDKETGDKETRTLWGRRKLINDWIELFKQAGCPVVLTQIKKAVRDFEKGEKAA